MARKIPLWITASLIVVLGAATIALSYLALTGATSEGNEGLPVNPGASTQLAVEAGFPVPEPAPELPVEPINLMSSSRMLAAADGMVVRAIAGTCESPGTVEFSEDIGQSWRASESLAGVGGNASSEYFGHGAVAGASRSTG